MKMVAREPSRQWDEHVQRPCGRRLNIFEKLRVEGCVQGGGTSGLEKQMEPDQAGACRPGSSLVCDLKAMEIL